jgi:hypothetical protein
VQDDGNEDDDESWVAEFGYKPRSSSTWTWTEDISGSGEGIYQLNVTGLSPNTQYDVTSRITNSDGTVYGDAETFWTAARSALPFVATLPARKITHTSGELELVLLDDGISSVVAQADTRFIYWRNGGQQVTTDWFATTEGEQSSVTIYGLDPNAEYLFYAEAKNSAGRVSGNTLNFKTLPDPNSPPIVFNSNEPNTLLIQNFVKAYQIDPNKPHNGQGLLAYIQGIGLNGIDPNDVLYSVVPGAKIVSLINEKNTKGEISGFYELIKDARPANPDPNDPGSLTLLELSLYNVNQEQTVSSENCLKFWIADDAFAEKTITIQQSSSEPNIVYPLWDVNEIINKNSRQLPLTNLVNQKVNVPYAYFVLSTNRKIADISDDGVIDLTDYSLLLQDLGKQGMFRSDIASVKGPGLPDGIVNATDEIAFITEYNKQHPDSPISGLYAGFSYDFESGEIESPFITYGDLPWIISRSAFSGNYCAKSGDIGDNQRSILEVNVTCTKGEIHFYRKVSSENYFDSLRFYIDDVKTSEWSGDTDWEGWEEMIYTVPAGTYTLKFEYKKDGSNSEGQDAAWIDDINVQ